MTRNDILIAVVGSMFIANTTLADCPYWRSGWEADMPVGFHDAEGIVTMIDERTLQVEHFTYDGTAPLVFFYLGATNTHQGFLNGIPIGPQLDRAYIDETLTLTLPPGQTLEGYNAISVWCVDVSVSFTSASFIMPEVTDPRAGWQADLSTIFHDVNGFVTIINDHILHAKHFDYDGAGLTVYFYLGATDTQQDFVNGLEIGPLLNTQPYNDDSLVVVLPPGETMDGYGAISVWCVDVNVNFGSGAFVETTCGDMNCDGALNALDVGPFTLALTDLPAFRSLYPDCPPGSADLDQNGAIEIPDIAEFVQLILES